jgi:exonuclease III
MIRVLVVHKDSGFIWNFINVYGAAQDEHENRFLSELSLFCSKCKYPVLVGGDFNILRKENEKNKPGGVTKWSSLFNSIIDLHSLIELELVNRRFTWSNNRSDPTFEKLDRFLVSPDCDLHYNSVTVSGLSRTISDHLPLYLNTGVVQVKNRDFRYELCWKLRADFRQRVVENWSLPVRCRSSVDVWKEKSKRLKNVGRLEYQC